MEIIIMLVLFVITLVTAGVALDGKSKIDAKDSKILKQKNHIDSYRVEVAGYGSEIKKLQTENISLRADVKRLEEDCERLNLLLTPKVTADTFKDPTKLTQDAKNQARADAKKAKAVREEFEKTGICPACNKTVGDENEDGCDYCAIVTNVNKKLEETNG